jgi:hypothetical protein
LVLAVLDFTVAALASGLDGDLVLAAAGLAAVILAADVFATGMTQNLKQRAYNHNSHRRRR